METYIHMLKANSHQILLSDMSPSGFELLTAKLLPKTLVRFEEENPSNRRCKVAFVERKCAVTSSVHVRLLYVSYNYRNQVENSTYAHAVQPRLLAVVCCVYAFRNYFSNFQRQYCRLCDTKSYVMSYHTSTGLLRTFQA